MSGNGDDANPCARTAPCKTFAGAISKTAAGGEISVMDPGAFGAVTITKSISIGADGLEAGIIAVGTNGILVNAGATDTVHLRGLTIEGTGGGVNGLKIVSAKSVVIDRSLIRGSSGSPGAGISVEPTVATVRVTVLDSTISNNQTGVNVAPTGTGVGIVVLDRVRVLNSKGVGVRAVGANARIRMANSVATGNDTALDATGGATLRSVGPSNLICCNITATGAFTGVETFE